MNVDITDLKTVRLSQDGSAVIILDQTCLPGSEVYVSLSSAEEIWEAIYRLKVRGAPAIGIAAAYGIYVSIRKIAAKTEGSKDYFTSQFINDKLAKALEDNTATKDKLEDYMGKGGTAMDLTDAKGVTKKDKLPLGLYLIVETKVPEDVTYTTNPWFVQLQSTDSEGDDWFYEVVCYPKIETGVPTLDKRVRNNPDKDNVTTANQDALADFTHA